MSNTLFKTRFWIRLLKRLIVKTSKNSFQIVFTFSSYKTGETCILKILKTENEKKLKWEWKVKIKTRFWQHTKRATFILHFYFYFLSFFTFSIFLFGWIFVIFSLGHSSKNINSGHFTCPVTKVAVLNYLAGKSCLIYYVLP